MERAQSLIGLVSNEELEPFYHRIKHNSGLDIVVEERERDESNLYFPSLSCCELFNNNKIQ
jgi:hypothetical protein